MSKKKHKKYVKEGTEMATKATGITGYCMKCKAKRTIKDPKQITHPNGRAAVTGVCSVCGTKIFRMGKMLGGETKTGTAPASEQEQEPGDWGRKRSKVKIS